MDIPAEHLYFWIASAAVFARDSLFKRVYKHVVEDKVVEHFSRAVRSKNLKKIQSELFGMHKNSFTPLIGSNTWTSKSGAIYSNYDGSIPIPPYIDSGVNLLADAYKESGDWQVMHADGMVKNISKDTVCLIGGPSINEGVRKCVDVIGGLRFRFVPSGKTKYKLTENVRVRRTFKDENDVVYTKQSRSGLYLVDSSDPDRPPFGPFISDEGRVLRDVLLLTVIRSPFGGRLFWVTAGYGAPVRLVDVLCDGDILEMISTSAALAKRSEPWFQAVFSVDVTHKNDSEVYAKPVFECCERPYL